MMPTAHEGHGLQGFLAFSQLPFRHFEGAAWAEEMFAICEVERGRAGFGERMPASVVTYCLRGSERA